jgi:gluconolactonase
MSQVWDEGAGVRLLADGGTWLEGPCWTPDGVLVSDIPANRVLRWTGESSWDIVVADAEFANGRTRMADGRIIQCSHGRRAVEELLPDGTSRTLVDHFGSARLNSPNDMVVALDGAVWFTDPPYGIVQAHEGHPGDREYGDNFVFRFDPHTGELRPVIVDVEEPNGLAFSPDASTLYVADTSAALRKDGSGNRRIRAYDVVEGSACKNGRTFAEMNHGLADGFRVDVEGRIWTSDGPNVTVLSTAGDVVATIEIGRTVGNVCFGPDGDLYVAASDALFLIRTHTQGAQW